MPQDGRGAATHRVPDRITPCLGTDFCRWARGCSDCRPEKWQEYLPLQLRYDHHGSMQGASYEFARRAVPQLAAELRRAADGLEKAYHDGFRLYEIDDHGVIRLAKGRAPR